MREFISTHGVDAFHSVDDPLTQLWMRFGVTSQSSYVYINDDGTWEVSGYGSLAADVEALITN